MRNNQFLMYSFIIGVIWYILLIALIFPPNNSSALTFFPHCVILSYAMGFNFFGGKYNKKLFSIIGCILYIVSIVVGMDFAKNYMEFNRVKLLFLVPIAMTGLSTILSIIGIIVQLCKTSDNTQNTDNGNLSIFLSLVLGITFFISFSIISYKYIHINNAIIYYIPLFIGLILNFLSFKYGKKILSLIGALSYTVLGVMFYLHTPTNVQGLHIYLPIFMLPQIILSLMATIYPYSKEGEVTTQP